MHSALVWIRLLMHFQLSQWIAAELNYAISVFDTSFSGNETKLGMSRGIPEPKLTALDAMIDKLTGAIFVFQIVVVMVLGIAGNVWKDTEARKVTLLCLPDCDALLLFFR